MKRTTTMDTLALIASVLLHFIHLLIRGKCATGHDIDYQPEKKETPLVGID